MALEDENEEELKPGFLTRNLADPWVSLPFALLSAFGAGATPGTARFTQGLHGGLRMGLEGEAADYERQKQRRLSDVMKGEFGVAEKPINATGAAAPNLSDKIKEEDIGADTPFLPSSTLASRPGVPSFESQRMARINSLGRRLAPIEPKTAMELLIKERTREPREEKTHIVERLGAKGGKVRRLMTEAEMRAEGDIPMPEAERLPPSLDDNLVDQGLADIAAGRPISRRVMEAYGTDDATDVKSRLLMRNQIRREREVQKKRDDMDIALVKTNRELALKPMQGMVLDAKTGEVVPATQGDYAQNPKAYIRLTASQERLKAGLDTAKTHMIVTSKFVGELPKSGLRVTNALGQKISQLQNEPGAVALFQQLHSMTSLAVGSALVAGAGGRPGVRLAEFMGPAGVVEGDTLATAVKKMQNWMEIVSRNAKEGGLPSRPYAQAVEEMNYNIAKSLVQETGSVEKAKKLAKQYGLELR